LAAITNAMITRLIRLNAMITRLIRLALLLKTKYLSKIKSSEVVTKKLDTP